MRISFDRSGAALGAAAFALALCAAPLHADAAISFAAGGYSRSDPSQAGGAVILSTGTSVPSVPLEVQGSLFVPFTGKTGYAATAEIRGLTGGGYGGAYVGAGAGVGTLSSDGSSGAVLTVFAGKSIAPFTSIELRFYKQTESPGAAAGFVGLRFSL
jgi:hypothetical protein